MKKFLREKKEQIHASYKQHSLATQAYEFFSAGKNPVQVAIALNLRESEVTRFYEEFWKLKHLDELFYLYEQIKQDLPTFRMFISMKKRGMRIDNLEWFIDAIEIGVYKLPQLYESIRILKIKQLV